MKTLLITAFAAVLALQVQGQKILQEYIDPDFIVSTLLPAQLSTKIPLESYEDNSQITRFTHNDAGEITGYYVIKKTFQAPVVQYVQLTASENKKTEYVINVRRDTTINTYYYDAQDRIYRTDIAINEEFAKSTSSTTITFGLDGRVDSKITNSNGSYDTGYLWSKKDSTVNTYDSRNRMTKSLTIHIKNDNFVAGTVVTRDSTLKSYDDLDRLTTIIMHTDSTSGVKASTETFNYNYTVDESDPSITIRNWTSPARSDSSGTYINKYKLGINKQGLVIYYTYTDYKNDIEDYRMLMQLEYNANNNLTEKRYTWYNTYNQTGELAISYSYYIKYEYNEDGDIIKSNYNRINQQTGNTTESSSTIYTYLQDAKATNVAIYANQKIAVTFNYELDPATANVKDMLQLSNNSSGLSISNAYVNAENNSQLIIELNRQVVKDESFDIATTSKLPLKYGRTVALEVKVDGQTPTADGTVRPSQIVVSQTSAGISITAGAEIVSVKVFTASGVLAQSLQPASTEATISTENLPAGVYQVFATDADGNSASQTVSF